MYWAAEFLRLSFLPLPRERCVVPSPFDRPSRLTHTPSSLVLIPPTPQLLVLLHVAYLSPTVWLPIVCSLRDAAAVRQGRGQIAFLLRLSPKRPSNPLLTSPPLTLDLLAGEPLPCACSSSVQLGLFFDSCFATSPLSHPRAVRQRPVGFVRRSQVGW